MTALPAQPEKQLWRRHGRYGKFDHDPDTADVAYECEDLGEGCRLHKPGHFKKPAQPYPALRTGIIGFACRLRKGHKGPHHEYGILNDQQQECGALIEKQFQPDPALDVERLARALANVYADPAKRRRLALVAFDYADRADNMAAAIAAAYDADKGAARTDTQEEKK